jgi:hypothetical protein
MATVARVHAPDEMEVCGVLPTRFGLMDGAIRKTSSVCDEWQHCGNNGHQETHSHGNCGVEVSSRVELMRGWCSHEKCVQ